MVAAARVPKGTPQGTRAVKVSAGSAGGSTAKGPKGTRSGTREAEVARGSAGGSTQIYPQPAGITGCPKDNARDPSDPGGYGTAPDVNAPKSCHACHREENLLWLWPRELPAGGAEVVQVPARCGSWRHPGPCRDKRASVDFARICEAFEPFDPQSLVFFVLTLDRDGSRGGRGWAHEDCDCCASPRDHAFRHLGRAWARLRQRIDYHLLRCRCCIGAPRSVPRCPPGECSEALASEGIGSRWVMVVEQHRSGWPHCNVMAVCPALAADRRRHYHHQREIGRTQRQAILVDDRGLLQLERHVVGAGFGVQSSCEWAQSHEALAGYFAGLGDAPLGEAKPRKHWRDGKRWRTREPFDRDGSGRGDMRPVGSTAGELAKMIQTPTAAPAGFRRLRAGVRFLPEKRKRHGWTGALVTRAGKVIQRRRREPDSDASREQWRRIGGARRAPRDDETRRRYLLDSSRARVYAWDDGAAGWDDTGPEWGIGPAPP